MAALKILKVDDYRVIIINLNLLNWDKERCKNNQGDVLFLV